LIETAVSSVLNFADSPNGESVESVQLFHVIAAKAGIQGKPLHMSPSLDSRFRGNDNCGGLGRAYGASAANGEGAGARQQGALVYEI